MTPAPEEAKGVMWVGTEKPIKVQAEKVFPIGKNHVLGTCQDDVTVSVKKRGSEEVVQVNMKDKIVVDETCVLKKGFSEVVVEDKAIPVGVEGTTTVVDKNVSGYYLVHKDDLRALIHGAKNTTGPNAK